MTEIQNSKQGSAKQYDLEERTFKFAKAVRIFVKKLLKTTGNFEDSKQLVRSSGSIGANYIEANESLSKKDFLMRIKIARKEAKETLFWLNLLDTNQDKNLETECLSLIKECKELKLILSSILQRSE
ncbi:MAG: four helix bundle protein [Patescibacteria group bacterium]